jgi:hypothetical protein
MDHIEYAQIVADRIFKKRKATAEIHVSQAELVAMLALAYEAGQKSKEVTK